MKKICFYALCTLLSVGCKVSHQLKTKNRKKEKSIDSLAPNPFISMYTQALLPVYGMTAVCMSMHHMRNDPQGCDLMDRYHVFSTENGTLERSW